MRRSVAVPAAVVVASAGALIGLAVTHSTPSPKHLSASRPSPSVLASPAPAVSSLAPRVVRSPPSIAPRPSPSTRLVIYAVQPGDTLSAIAWNVHVPVATLYAWNQIVVGPWPDLLFPGEPLIVGKASS